MGSEEIDSRYLMFFEKNLNVPNNIKTRIKNNIN